MKEINNANTRVWQSRGKDMNDSNPKNSTRLTIVEEPSLNVFEKVQELENHYKQGTLLYAQRLQLYRTEIESIKHQIKTQKSSMVPEVEALKNVENNVIYDTRTLEKLHEKFSKHIDSIQELQTEYKEMLDKTAYNKIFKRKKQQLIIIEDEIESLEASLLAFELERLNVLSMLKPKEKVLEDLKLRLKQLELEKVHFESTQLYQLTQLSLNQEKENNIVEIELQEEHKEES